MKPITDYATGKKNLASYKLINVNIDKTIISLKTATHNSQEKYTSSTQIKGLKWSIRSCMIQKTKAL